MRNSNWVSLLDELLIRRIKEIDPGNIQDGETNSHNKFGSWFLLNNLK
jgi:hypothetical protein